MNRALRPARRRAIASFLRITRSRSSAAEQRGLPRFVRLLRFGPSNLKVGRSQCMGRLPRPLIVEQSRLPPTSLPANDNARPTAGALSPDCALSPPISRPHPPNSGEFLVSCDLQNESLIY